MELVSGVPLRPQSGDDRERSLKGLHEAVVQVSSPVRVRSGWARIDTVNRGRTGY